MTNIKMYKFFVVITCMYIFLKYLANLAATKAHLVELISEDLLLLLILPLEDLLTPPLNAIIII